MYLSCVHSACQNKTVKLCPPFSPPVTLVPKCCNILALAVVELGIGTTKILSLRSSSHYSILDKLVFDPVDIGTCPEILLHLHLYAPKKTDGLGEEAKKTKTLYIHFYPCIVLIPSSPSSGARGLRYSDVLTTCVKSEA